MKIFIVSALSLLLGLAIGFYFKHCRAKRQMTYVVEQMLKPIESSDRLEATRGIRAIELIEAGNTNQAIEMFSFPIADFYLQYAHAGADDERTIKLRAQIEQLAKTNQVIAARIREASMNY